MDMAKINGEYGLIAEAVSVSVFLAARGINRDMVAVEVNGEILPKDAFETTILKDEDEIEIVNFVCGG
jgi:thiamine biosynthesis protein ThiS